MIGKQILHYKILEELGRGGVGVVYKAEDTKLKRDVAIKFLPRQIAASEEERERFKIEAQAAGALNHPNIATIHAIEESDDEMFIVMEYIDGKELKQIVGVQNVEPQPMDEIINYATQIAAGLQAAHENHVIHRDIKSANIMITEKGSPIKIMDFGLAKIGGSTQLTKDQSTLGTAAYMSPEQARGEEADHRSDIWAFGVVLYEMLTGQMPFPGDYEQAVIYSILNEEPEPIANHRTIISPELQHILTSALEKDAEDRYQSMSEVLRDLRRLKKQTSRISDTQPLSPTPTDSSISAPESPPAKAATASAKKGLIITLSSLLGGLIIIVGLWQAGVFEKKSAPVALQNMQISRLTTNGKSSQASISPDGNYVVYVQEDRGKQSLWMRQVATTSSIEIVAAAKTTYEGNTISHDGNFIFYVVRDAANPIGGLYKVPILGGTPNKILSHIDSPVTLSPDDTQLAFVRRYEQAGKESMIITGIDGSNERELTSRIGEELFLSEIGTGPSWSPDGKNIACGAAIARGEFVEGLLGVDVETGEQKWIARDWIDEIRRVAWLNDGSGLVANIKQKISDPTKQLWYISYPEGAMSRITNDLSEYGQFSLGLTADNSTIVSVQQERASNIWISKNNGNNSFQQITSGARNIYGIAGLSAAPDGRIVYASGGIDIITNSELWIMSADGSGQRQLTSNKDDFAPIFSPDGKHIFLGSRRSGIGAIWKMDADGRNPEQLTNLEEYTSDVTPDGKWLIYYSYAGGTVNIWKKSIAGGEPIQLTDKPSSFPVVSPDGKYFACRYQSHPDSAFSYAIIPIEGGKPEVVLPTPPTASQDLVWSRDGKSILYHDRRDGVSNVWRQTIDNGKTMQVTVFTDSDHIYRIALSPDGRLMLARGPQTSDVVLIRNFR